MNNRVKGIIGNYVNLVRALDEDTGFSPSTSSLLLHRTRHLFLGIPPFTSNPGNLCLLLDTFVSPSVVYHVRRCLYLYTHTYTHVQRGVDCLVANPS